MNNDAPLLILLVARGDSFAVLEEFVSVNVMDVEEVDVGDESGYKFFDDAELNRTRAYLNTRGVLYSLSFPIPDPWNPNAPEE